MWNNGNGQNNGGGQDDVYGRLNNTREVGGARYPFIENGQHKFALAVLEEFQHQSDGTCARAILKVIESRAHAPGSFVVKIWKLVKPPFKPGMTTDSDEFADFCRKLKNAPIGYPIGNDIRVLMKERPLDQLARGSVIECNGVMNKKGNYVKTYFSAVVQTPQDIATMRQRIEAEGLPSANGPAQAPPQQYVPPAAQSQYGQQSAMQQYAPQPQAPAPAAPAGGFLANVPPTGGAGGNTGGNTGGSGW